MGQPKLNLLEVREFLIGSPGVFDKVIDAFNSAAIPHEDEDDGRDDRAREARDAAIRKIEQSRVSARNWIQRLHARGTPDFEWWSAVSDEVRVAYTVLQRDAARFKRVARGKEVDAQRWENWTLMIAEATADLEYAVNKQLRVPDAQVFDTLRGKLVFVRERWVDLKSRIKRQRELVSQEPKQQHWETTLSEWLKDSEFGLALLLDLLNTKRGLTRVANDAVLSALIDLLAVVGLAEYELDHITSARTELVSLLNRCKEPLTRFVGAVKTQLDAKRQSSLAHIPRARGRQRVHVVKRV